MHILFLTHYFPPEGNAPASRVHEMAKRWVTSGHEVTVITCAPNVPDGVVYEGYKNKWRQTEMVDGIQVIRVWTYLAPNKGTAKRIINFCSYLFSAVWCGLFKKRPDVMIATSPQFFCGWAGTILRTLRRWPFILEIRDIWPESITAVGANLNPRLIRILEAMERKMYQSAQTIVTVGPGYKEQLIKKNVPEEKLHVITNGICKDTFQAADDDLELRQKYGLEDKLICSFIGTIGMACGLDVVIRAAKLLRDSNQTDIHFMLVGDGAMREALENTCQEEELTNVTLTGRQPKQDMPRFLAMTDICLVHLTKTDLFKTVLPSKIFEACAMRRPIILGVEGNAAELVKEANAGICIEPENELELLEALKRLHADPALRESFGQQGQQHVQAHYDRDQLANDYLEIIQQSITSRP